MSDWFESLSTRRRKFVASMRENNFERGIHQSTVEKYADPAHFVYELLQNAEDQNATSAMFFLNRDGLIFVHDGKSFTEQDVENITGLGNSEKPQQANKIGRFGIGFKSVFAITNRPCIETRLNNSPFAFAIEDLVVPETLPQPGDVEHRTKFILPFLAGQEQSLHNTIRNKLLGLGADALLFLDHLKSICWQAGEEEVTLLCQREEGGGYCRLIQETPNATMPATHNEVAYRLYSKQVHFKDADRDLTVRLAFRIENGQLTCEPGLSTANVFFPTEEKTGLKFRLHAPFLLNDSRANIKQNNPVNVQLIRACADLLIEVLPNLRDRGLLTGEALACLPLREDDFPARDELFGSAMGDAPFRPLFEAVRTAFRTQELLPTALGSSVPHVKAAKARVSDSKPLRQLFGQPQLTALSGNTSTTPVCWISEKIAKNVTREIWDYLTKVLEIDDLDGEKVARQLDARFLETQTDEWMVRFYEFLNDQPALWRMGRIPSLAGPLRSKPIIRVEICGGDPNRGNTSTNQITPFVGELSTPNVYLGAADRSGFRVVKPAIQQNAEALRFLMALGLKEPDVTDFVIRRVLQKYVPMSDDIKNISESQYAEDLTLIAQAIGTDVVADRNRLDVAFNNKPFIKAFNAANPNDLSWKKPAQVHLPEPELLVWFAGNPNIWYPHEEVLTHPRWDAIVNFVNCNHQTMPNTIGVKAKRPESDNHVTLVDRRGRHQRGLNRFDPDATVEEIDYALNHINIGRSRILWRLLLANIEQISGTVEESTFANYSNATQSDQLSYLGERVRTHGWLPDQASEYSGVFYIPSEIVLMQLPDEFSDDVNAQELSIKLGINQPAEEEVAEKLGVPADALAAFVIAYKRDPEITKLFDLRPAPEFPSILMPNSERRMAKVIEQALNAPDVTFEMKNRSVRVFLDGFYTDKRVYLRHFYESEDGKVLCQICCKPMPFRLYDDTDYFEAVECLKRFPTEHPQNHLALCPVCAAKYKYANGYSDDQWRNAVAESDSMEISIILAREEVKVRFVEPHLVDLKAILSAAFAKATSTKDVLK